MHPDSTGFNGLQQVHRKPFNTNHLESTRIHRFQQGLESGSGPGGRWFKSTRPDQISSNRSLPLRFRETRRAILTCDFISPGLGYEAGQFQQFQSCLTLGERVLGGYYTCDAAVVTARIAELARISHQE